MSFPTGRFRPADRLLRSSQFNHVLRHGRRSPVGELVFLAARSSANPPATRLGLTMSRRVGNAVVRNHVKRRVREWFRSHGETLPAETDIVVIGRRGAGDLSGREISARLDTALARHTGATR